jgi:hypothetical protein
VSIDPPNPPAHELADLHELHDFSVRDRACPVNPRIRLEQATSPSAVPDQELTLDEIVTQYLVCRQQLVERGREGFPSGQEANPDGRVDEDH